MADELTVKVGYRVSTEEQASHAHALLAFEADLTAIVGRVNRVDRGLRFVQATLVSDPVLAFRAEVAIDEARFNLMLAIGHTRLASAALRGSVVAYGEAERAVTALSRKLGSLFGYGLGRFGPLVMPWLLSPLLMALTGLGVASLIPGGRQLLQNGAAAVWAEHRDILSDPVTVELLRAAVMGSDDLLAGVLHLPLESVVLLGDQGLGVTGVSTVAGVLVALANRAGTLKEAPVVVTRTATATAVPPTGLRDRLARVPYGTAHQVRVERYAVAGKPHRVEVFIGGTVEMSPIVGEQPWDMTSNAHGAAELEPASLRAVRQAMSDAGVTPGDRIAITGYSQGALVGALLAASGDYSVDFLLEVGGPSGQVPVPDSVNHVRIDHSADLVTALGGDVRGEHTVQIRRDGVPEAIGQGLPGHSYHYYLETAELADRSQHPEIRNAVAAADAPLVDVERGRATEWQARRDVTGARE